MSPPIGGTKPSNAYGRRRQKQNLKASAKDLEDAISGVIPSHKKPYGQVAVLGMHWENDGMGVAGLERELLDVFREKYKFYTESYPIPVQASAAGLSNKLSAFSQKWAAPHALRVYVYSGHAEAADPHATQYHLAYVASIVFQPSFTSKLTKIRGRADAQGRLVGPRVDWYRASYIVENAGPQGGGDVLYIFDCCSAGAAATYDGPEFLAAAAWDATAGSAINTSFTRILIDELNVLNGAPQTIASIFASMFRNATQSQLDALPVHIIKRGTDSITLAKLAGPKQMKPEAFETRKRKGKFPVSDGRVLLSVQLEDDVTFPDLEQWKTWLTTNIPLGIFDVDITIESLFTGSRVLLVTVPLEVWTMLPANEDAYAFVAHVSSNNVLPNFSSPSRLA